MHSKINLSKINISKSDLRAYNDFNNVFRKFYCIDSKLLENQKVQINNNNKVFIIFKDMVCSNIKFNKIYFKNKDFVIGSL